MNCAHDNYLIIPYLQIFWDNPFYEDFSTKNYLKDKNNNFEIIRSKLHAQKISLHFNISKLANPTLQKHPYRLPRHRSW